MPPSNQPSTTDLVQLKELKDGVIILKDGSLRAIVQVSAINFELRSSDEQVAILEQFAGFLNSVDFAFQMVVHSRRFDINVYLATVKAATEQLTNELMKVQAEEYMRFVSELSDLSNIMSKSFYIILPLSVVPVSTSKGFLGGIKDMFKKAPAQQEIAPERLASFKEQLQQRADLVIGGLSGMGLTGHMMNQEELTKLFGELYNPIVPATKHAPAQ
jgi:type IV secretory pathway VirB4 component